MDSLFLAAEIGSIDSVRYCLQNKVDINSINKRNLTSLMVASKAGKSLMVEYLLREKALPDVDNLDTTALILASLYNFPNITKKLLHYNANPNAKDKQGMTALMYACEDAHMDIIEQLFAIKDIELEAKTKDDKSSAIIFAAQNNQAEVIRKLANKNMEIVNLKHKDGVTALMMASVMGQIYAIEALIEKKALIDLLYKNEKDGSKDEKDGSSALMLALYYKHPDAAIKLLMGGANPNLARLSDNVTPLMLAASQGYEDVVCELLEKRHADCSCKDKDDKDAVEYARDSGYEIIATRIHNYCTNNSKIGRVI